MGTINKVVWDEAQAFIQNERPTRLQLRKSSREWEQSLAMAAFVEKLFNDGIISYTTKAYRPSD